MNKVKIKLKNLNPPHNFILDDRIYFRAKVENDDEPLGFDPLTGQIHFFHPDTLVLVKEPQDA